MTRLGLSMIVKDEALVIERCLRSALPLLDWWVIADTGSTDGTQDIVRSVMGGVPGQLIERPWVDFGHNRQESLDAARNLEHSRPGDYVLWIDADDSLADLPAELPDLTADGYHLEVDDGDTSYSRLQVVRLDRPWKWTGVVHEHLDLPEASLGSLESPRVIRRREGARSRDPETYRMDAALIDRELAKAPDDPRLQFYLGQSWRDAGELELALAAYRRRAANPNGWDQEQWYALFQVAVCLERLERPAEEVSQAYLTAFAAMPSRSEPLSRAGPVRAGAGALRRGIALRRTRDPDPDASGRCALRASSRGHLAGVGRVRRQLLLDRSLRRRQRSSEEGARRASGRRAAAGQPRLLPRAHVLNARSGLRALSSVVWPTLPGALVAWVVAAAALFRPHALSGIHSYTGNGYDDGVYLGASVRLLHGSLPYLDLDLVHPPGVLWLGAPFAALGELTDGSAALAAVRILTVLVWAGLNVLLAGAVVRSAGRLAVFLAGSLLALMPVSYGATQTLLLEPYVVLCALAGLAVLGTATGGGGRVSAAGAARRSTRRAWRSPSSSSALSSRSPSSLPCWPRWREDAGTGASGCSRGFGAIPTLPLALARAVSRSSGTSSSSSSAARRRRPRARPARPAVGDARPRRRGRSGSSDRAAWVLAAAVALVVGGLALQVPRSGAGSPGSTSSRWSRAAVVFAGMAQQRQFFDHYAYVVVASLACQVGIGAAVLVEAGAAALAPGRRRRTHQGCVRPSCWSLVRRRPEHAPYTDESTDPSGRWSVSSCRAGRAWRPTSPPCCSSRTGWTPRGRVTFRSTRSASGSWRTTSPRRPTPPPFRNGDRRPVVGGGWRTADFVVLSVPRSNYIPWTTELGERFRTGTTSWSPRGPGPTSSYRLPD